MSKPPDPFRWFDSSPEVIRLVVMMYIRCPLSLRNAEDLLFERGINICHETVRLWWTRFGPMFAAEIRRKRVSHMRQFTHWRWHLDEVYVKINGEMRYLWRAVDHEGDSTPCGETTPGSTPWLRQCASLPNWRDGRRMAAPWGPSQCAGP
jgi:putative transposase